MQPKKSRPWFTRFANWTAQTTGRPSAFGLATATIIVWIVTGPLFDFDNTWQLVINTGTTIVTFLMVFLIQNTQNVDSQAMQIKLDELIRATQGAHNGLLDLEQLEEEALEAIRFKYQKLAEYARADLLKGDMDTGIPKVDEERLP